MLAYWLAGIGTLLLAGITFYEVVLKQWRERPQFSVSFKNTKPYCRKTTIASGAANYAKAYWLRVRVTNSGRSVAKRCIGKLVKVVDKSGKELTDYDPVALHWVGTDHDEVPLRPIDLNKEEYEYLDVIYTRDDRPGEAFIARDRVPRGIPNYFSQGEYILWITIYGDNVRPKPKAYRLTWNASNYLDISLKEIKQRM